MTLNEGRLKGRPQVLHVVRRKFLSLRALPHGSYRTGTDKGRAARPQSLPFTPRIARISARFVPTPRRHPLQAGGPQQARVLHTVNGSGLAVGRTLIAVLETTKTPTERSHFSGAQPLHRRSGAVSP